MATAKNTESKNHHASLITVLIVDNDKHHAQAMSEILERVGYDCIQATSGPEGAKKIDQHDYDVVITDLMMNDVNGMQVLSRAKASLPNCEVIMVTGHGTIPKAVEAMQKGAFTFIEKPIHAEGLRAATEKAADAVRLRRTNLDLHKRLDEKFGFDRIIYASAEMQAVIDKYFAEWRLSDAERDVALLLLKGLDNETIASIRGTATGTVRAQCAGIYAKAGVDGRSQLMSVFMEELLSEPLGALRDGAAAEAA